MACGFESLINSNLYSFARNFLVQFRLEIPREILPSERVITLIAVYDRGYDKRVVSNWPLSAKVIYPCKKPDSKQEHPYWDWDPRFNSHHCLSVWTPQRPCQFRKSLGCFPRLIVRRVFHQIIGRRWRKIVRRCQHAAATWFNVTGPGKRPKADPPSLRYGATRGCLSILRFPAILRGKSVVRFCTTVFGTKAKHLFLLFLFWSIPPPHNFCFPNFSFICKY